MTDSKYKRYVGKLDKYGARPNIIVRLDAMNAILATDSYTKKVYFVHGGCVTCFNYSELRSLTCEDDIEDGGSGGSLSGTLIGGALFGDIGALVGSGLLSQNDFTEYFVLCFAFYDSKPFTVKFNADSREGQLSADYEAIEEVLTPIILTNKRTRRIDPYATESGKTKKLRRIADDSENTYGLVCFFLALVIVLTVTIFLWNIVK